VKTLFYREFLGLSFSVFTFLKFIFIQKLFKYKLLVSNAALSEHLRIVRYLPKWIKIIRQLIWSTINYLIKFNERV
jgi:hypothetical protein